MHQFVTIFQIACGGSICAYRCIGAIEQYLAINALCYPAVLQLLTCVLQFKEKLLMRKVQVVAGRCV